MPKYFSLAEFACHHCGQNRVEPLLLDRLDELRGAYGSPLLVVSGYRCPAHNLQVSTTGIHGPHVTGLAADIACDRGGAWLVLKIAMNLGFTGVGVAQKGQGRYLHLDLLPQASGRPRPTVWSY